MYQLTETDLQFCQKKEREYLATREYYLKLYEYSRATMPKTDYQTRYSSHYAKINPVWYLRQEQGLAQQFANDLAQYLQETYYLPLQIGYYDFKIERIDKWTNTVQPALSYQEVLAIIANQLHTEDFLAFSIQYLRTRFLDCAKNKATVHHTVLSLSHFVHSCDLLYHVLSLFDTGHPARQEKYLALPRLNMDDTCGIWHMVNKTNSGNVVALKGFKNGKVQVKFVSEVETEVFYQQFCVREEPQ